MIDSPTLEGRLEQPLDILALHRRRWVGLG